MNYGYLGIIFAIGLTGLLLYNFGLSNAHPIIISAILNLSPFWAALVALVLAGVPIPISRATFFGCFAGAFIGAMAVAWSQLGDKDTSNHQPTDGQFSSRQLDLCDSRAIGARPWGELWSANGSALTMNPRRSRPISSPRT